MAIGIITGFDDVHADHVIPLLEAKGQEVIRLNTDNFSENVDFTVIESDWNCRCQLRDSNRSFLTKEVSAVWYRKPVPICVKGEHRLEAANEFANGEFNSFFKSFLDLLSNAFWLSCHDNIRQAGRKLPNLRIAADLGLSIPQTIVTNSIDDARFFAKKVDWKLLAKPFALTTFKTKPHTNTSWDTFATAIDEETFSALEESLSLAPVILQERVEKDIELRITIVGNQIFSTSIHSQEHAFAQFDWRAVDVEELVHQPHTLPAKLKGQLLAFNQHFGLEFSTHDLILRPDGEYIWLECNPNGQWLWIEHLTGQGIGGAIADILTKPEVHALCI